MGYEDTVRLWGKLMFLLLFLPGCVVAQTRTAQRGSTVDRLVTSPERLSGVWETPDQKQGAVGLHFLLTTRVAGAPTALTNVPQYQEHLTIGVYERNTKELRPGDQNYFEDSPGSGILWDGKHLILKWQPRAAGDPAIDLDLTYDIRRQTWEGQFHRGGFSRHVTLRRPMVKGTTSRSRLTGTWTSDRPGMFGCVHIFQQADGGLTGWSDDLQSLARTRYAKGIMPPVQTYERYGDLAKVKEIDKDTFSIEFKAYSAMCCSHNLIARVSPGGTTIDGDWQAGGNQIEMKTAWRKAEGDSCIGQSF